MNFLNVGPWELMVILIIAILVVGPRRMVEIARTIGQITSQLRRLTNEFVGSIETELRETEREAHESLGGVLEGMTEDEPGSREE